MNGSGGIRDEVIEFLAKYADDTQKLLSALGFLIQKNGNETCTVILEVMANLSLPPERATDCWHKILGHRDMLAKALARPVNLQTALVDYFFTFDKTFKNPKVIEIEQYEETLMQAQYDKLTGLLNRYSFEDIFQQEISRADRHNSSLSLLFFDLDDFKKINDTFGHLTGDHILRKVSQVILEEKRDEDIVIRYGGEEIVMLLPETGKANSLVVGERIRQKVANITHSHLNKTFNVTISGGLAAFPYDATDVSNLLDDADSALRQAKKLGKNLIVLFSKDMRRYARCPFKSEILLKEVSFSKPNVDIVFANNISITGIGLLSNTPYDLDTKVQLRVPLDDSGLPHMIIGKVKRVRPTRESLYDIGISFMELDSLTRKKIIGYTLSNCSSGNLPASFA